AVPLLGGQVYAPDPCMKLCTLVPISISFHKDNVQIVARADRKTRPNPPQAFLGSSATSRIEVVRVSSWKWGRRYATASNQPGLPATGRTSTRASAKGRWARIVSLAPEGSTQ